MQINKVEIVQKLVETNAIQINSEPFVYSSGNRGPGYIMIKGLVGFPELVEYLVKMLAQKVNETIHIPIDFVDGNATGGMIYGWELCKHLSILQNRKIPYVYLRGSRKEGGHNELITGNLFNPNIQPGMNCLITEELVNYGTTTINAVNTFRKCGYKCQYAACILDYGYTSTHEMLQKNGIQLISLITLTEVLTICNQLKYFSPSLISLYQNYLDDPVVWQIQRDYTIPQDCVAQAKKKGYNMVKLNSEDAIRFGSPECKVKSGVVYYQYVPQSLKKLFIALDYDTQTQVLENASIFAKHSSDLYGFKVNLDSFFDFSSEKSFYTFIQQLKSFNKSIFVDLKMWNGLRTISNIVKACCEIGIDIINVYGHIGEYFLRELCSITKNYNTKLFVVTVLTHYDDEYCEFLYGNSMDTIVRKLSELAVKCGADGIILPATKLGVVNNLEIEKLCPGIRINSSNSNYQKQVSTPKFAINNGASYIVMGSPITKSKFPLQSLNNILKDLENQN